MNSALRAEEILMVPFCGGLRSRDREREREREIREGRRQGGREREGGFGGQALGFMVLREPQPLNYPSTLKAG